MARLIPVHLDASGATLGYIDDYDTPVYCIFEHGQKPVVTRGIPATESFHHDPFQVGNVEDAFHHLRRDARKRLQDSDVPVASR